MGGIILPSYVGDYNRNSLLKQTSIMEKLEVFFLWLTSVLIFPDGQMLVHAWHAYGFAFVWRFGFCADVAWLTR